jgi:hypothetical protein
VGFHFDCRKPFDPCAQIAGEQKCSPTPFDGAQFAGIDRLIKSRPTGAHNRARLGNTVGKWGIHRVLAIISRDAPGNRTRVLAGDGDH